MEANGVLIPAKLASVLFISKDLFNKRNPAL